MNIKTLVADYQIVTPMFLGSAKQEDLARINGASFKGVMRFWWRALNWHTTQGHDDNARLKELYANEAALFGKAKDKDNKGGQGLFLLKIKQHVNETISAVDFPKTDKGSAFLGYGLFRSDNDDKHVDKNAWNSSDEIGFSVTVILKHKIINEKQIEQLCNVLKVIGLCGGMGSRSRKGFGSLALVHLSYQNKPVPFAKSSLQDYKDNLYEFLNQGEDRKPPYTAISQQTQCRVSQTYTSAIVAHNEIGEMYKTLKKKIKDTQTTFVKGDDRQIFGLPLDDKDNKRRSSPLFIHIHPIQEQFVILLLYIPATFHPAINKEPNEEPMFELLDNEHFQGI